MKKNVWVTMLLLGISCCFCSCTGEPEPPGGSKEELNKTELIMYVGDSEIIFYSGTECSWYSDEPQIASVEDGTITAHHIGTTVIHANQATCTVNVIPMYTTFKEPYMNWGATKYEINELMSDYEVTSSDSYTLTYNGKGNVESYFYAFSEGKLLSSGMQISYSNGESLINYLSERYILTEQIHETVYMFKSIDGKLEGTIELNSSSYSIIVLYSPVSLDAQ